MAAPGRRRLAGAATPSDDDLLFGDLTTWGVLFLIAASIKAAWLPSWARPRTPRPSPGDP